jgi:hypothetical protein
MASVACQPHVMHVVPAVHVSARCPSLINGAQALFVRMATVLELAHGLFCELRSQFECPYVAVCSRGFLPLPVLSLEL